MKRFTIEDLIEHIKCDGFLAVEKVYPKKTRKDGFNMVYVTIRPQDEVREYLEIIHGPLTDEEFRKLYSQYYTLRYKALEQFTFGTPNLCYSPLTRESSPHIAVHHDDVSNPHRWKKGWADLPEGYVIID